jgi:YHS domain-containing protein
MAKDSVCGMQVDEQQAAGTSEHQGETYYFCSAGCKPAARSTEASRHGPAPTRQVLRS